MQVSSKAARALAAIVAGVIWTALALQLVNSLALANGALLPALSSMLRYFTVLTNLMAALVFTALAIGLTNRTLPSWLGLSTISLIVVGVVFALLLSGLRQLSELGVVADHMLHRVAPILVALYWPIAAAKGRLSRRDPLLWMLYPVGYSVYGMARGMMDGNFAYPFLDFPAKGCAYVAVHLVIIAIGFVVLGYALVWLDGRLKRR